MELPVQVNGKLRDKITSPADADEATILAAAETAPARSRGSRERRSQEAVCAEEAGEFRRHLILHTGALKRRESRPCPSKLKSR